MYHLTNDKKDGIQLWSKKTEYMFLQLEYSTTRHIRQQKLRADIIFYHYGLKIIPRILCQTDVATPSVN